MSKTNTLFLEKLILHFYDDEKKLQEVFTDPERKRLMRLRAINNQINKDPLMPDNQLVQWVRMAFGIGDSQAWKDIAEVNIIIGMIKQDKEALRYKLTQGLLQKMSNTQDDRAYASLAKVVASINRLPNNDPERLDPGKLHPLETVPTCDVKSLGEGYRELSDAELKKLLKLKKIRMTTKETDIIDVPYEEADPFTTTPTRLERFTQNLEQHE